MSKSGFTFGAAPVKRKGRKGGAKFRKGCGDLQQDFYICLCITYTG
jgi:hypothetical protein